MAKISYTKEEVLNKLKEINQIADIYNSDIINYRGNTKDTNEKYTEVIAEEIYNNSSKYNFDLIEKIKRERTYNVNHSGEYDPESIRTEELIAMKMFNNKIYPNIGKILDYQVPLKDVQGTKAGKIDLISLKEEENVLYLIELKNNKSIETLLRCILEIMTYLKQIDGEKLKSDFGIDSSVNIRPAILIFDQTRPFDDLNDVYANKLIEKFNIDIFIANIKIEETFVIEKN